MDPDLVEWDYGAYDSLTALRSSGGRPADAWHGGYPGGETLDGLADRRPNRAAVARDGAFALFAHGHILRVIAARWLEQPAIEASHYYLAPPPCQCWPGAGTRYRRERGCHLEVEHDGRRI